jgi:hypothetical protein
LSIKAVCAHAAACTGHQAAKREAAFRHDPAGLEEVRVTNREEYLGLVPSHNYRIDGERIGPPVWSCVELGRKITRKGTRYASSKLIV